ncbi:hypothetical protein [Streptomyces sp. NPDC050528]|uniref:hypothetical protein n=1 Tax=Streptomyces sp. NPDC050528 TaxID=3365623 RepID=UPI0037B1CC00
MSTDEERAETSGAGPVAVVAVLAPVLSGAFAAICLLVGYVLKLLDPEPAFAQTLRRNENPRPIRARIPLTPGQAFGPWTSLPSSPESTGHTSARNGPRSWPVIPATASSSPGAAGCGIALRLFVGRLRRIRGIELASAHSDSNDV